MQPPALAPAGPPSSRIDMMIGGVAPKEIVFRPQCSWRKTFDSSRQSHCNFNKLENRVMQPPALAPAGPPSSRKQNGNADRATRKRLPALSVHGAKHEQEI